MRPRRQWLIRNGTTTILLILLWNTALVKPLRVLVVLLHEIFHALAAVLTGGGVHAIDVISHRTGLTSLYGGAPGVVFSAGYLGTAFLGSLLIAFGHSYPVKRSLYLAMGALVLLSTIVFVRTPFGWAYGLLAGLFLMALFFKEFWFSPYITDFIGVLCIVDVFRDLGGFFFGYSRNDAAILSSVSGLSYYLILSLWTGIVLIIVCGAMLVTMKNLTLEKQGAKLQWQSFRFITPRSAERSLHMRSDGDDERKRGRRTIAVYVLVLSLIGLSALWASRYVLFQPWTAREWVDTAATRGDIYIFGGRDRQGQVYDEIFRIDLQELRIHRVAALPAARFAVATASLDDRIYLLGGYDGRRCFNDILVFDTTRDRISRLAELPGGRAFGAACVHSGRIYYIGGWDGADLLDQIVEIDPRSGHTRPAGRLPSPREQLSAESLSGRIFIFGGSDSHGDYLDEVVAFDPSGGPAVIVGRLPSGRTRTGSVLRGSEVLLIGGWQGSKLDEVVSLTVDDAPAVQLYAHLDRALSNIGAVNMEGEIYLVGGAHERFQRQIQVLRWKARPDRPAGPASTESIKLRSFLFW